MVLEELQTNDLTAIAFPFPEENRTEDLTSCIKSVPVVDHRRLRTPVLNYVFEGEKRTVLLDRSVFTIGRGNSNPLFLPLTNLSRIHGKITKGEKGGWYLEDCDSCNGTFLNGRRVPVGQKRYLGMAAKIQLGDFCLDFHYPLQKRIREFSPLVSLSMYGYFLLSSLWHSMILLGIFLLVWNEMTTLPGSKAFKVSLLIEKDTPETAPLAEEKLFGEIEPIEESKILREEPVLEPSPDEAQNLEEALPPSNQIPFSESVDPQNPLKQPISDSFSKRLFAKRNFAPKKEILGEKGTSKEKGTQETEGIPEPVEPDPIPKNQDPLLSKVQQIKSSILILNVPGAYDQSNFVLTQIGLKYKTVENILGLLVATPDKPLKNYQKLDLPPYLVPERDILVFNCGSFIQGAVTEKYSKKLAEFVAKGGYVLTTDWSLDWLVAAFPDKLTSSEKTIQQGNYSVRLNKNAMNHPLFHGMPKSKWNTKWFVEAQSSRPYLRSKEVLALANSNKGIPIAITFSAYQPISGEHTTSYPGRVLHYVSHLHKQELFGANGDYPFQIMLLNFILLKQKEYDLLLKLRTK